MATRRDRGTNFFLNQLLKIHLDIMTRQRRGGVKNVIETASIKMTWRIWTEHASAR